MLMLLLCVWLSCCRLKTEDLAVKLESVYMCVIHGVSDSDVMLHCALVDVMSAGC